MGFSTKKKRGRPAKVAVAWDHGNERVQARAELFRKFGGDSSKGHEFTCVGRLMLVGAFDGMEQDPATYLSAILEYSNAYWEHYSACSPRVATYELRERSHDNVWSDPRGEWFESMDGRLRDAGREARRAVQDISVSRHWFPDEDCGWSSRIINRRFADKGLPVCGEIALDGDTAWKMLESARLGATALAGRKLRKAA